jgi:hypothetical protein
MKSIVTSVFAALLFIALTPGVLLRLPPKGGKWTVLIVHALVFFVIYYLAHGLVYKYFNPSMRQGFDTMKKVTFAEPFNAKINKRKSNVKKQHSKGASPGHK